MNAVWFVALWILVGAAVLFVAFSGGPARARETYLTRGGRAVRWAFLAIFIGAGVVVPIIIASNSTSAVGGTGPLTDEKLNKQLTEGKALFRQNCASCHTLAAVQAKGVTGPNLDELGQLDKQRVLNAIRIGGTGQDRMPAGILQGGDAEAVAAYVSKVAGKTQ
jgi:cytochrome c553